MRPSVGQNVVSTLITNAISIPLTFTIGILLARALGPAGKGSYDLVFTTAALLGAVLGLSLPAGVTYVVAQGRSVLRSLSQQLAFLALLQGCLAAAFLYIIQQTDYSTAFVPPKVEEQAALVVIIFLVFAALSGCWRAMLIGRQEIMKVNRTEIINRLMHVVLVVAVVGLPSALRYQVSATTFMWINVSMIILISLMFLRLLYSSFQKSDGPSGLRAVIAFAIPCYLSNLVQFLNYRMDIFVVSLFVGIEGVGLYVVAVSVGQLIWLISNSAATVLLPKIAAAQGNQSENASRTAQITRLVLWVSLGLAVLFALGANLILPFVYGEAFRASIGPFLLLLPGIVIFTCTNVLAAYIAGIGKPQFNLIASLAGLFFTVVLDFSLIPRLNIIGAAIASTVSYSVSTVVTITFFVRQSRTLVRNILLLRAEDIRVLGSLLRSIPDQLRFRGKGS